MAEAAREADVFVSVTGDRDVMRREHFEAMRTGRDRQLRPLRCRDRQGRPGRPGRTVVRVRENAEEFTLEDGRRIILVAEGRLVNLGAAEGHRPRSWTCPSPTSAVAVVAVGQQDLEAGVYDVPAEIDAEVAKAKLTTMDIEIDTLTTPRRATSLLERGT